MVAGSTYRGAYKLSYKAGTLVLLILGEDQFGTYHGLIHDGFFPTIAGVVHELLAGSGADAHAVGAKCAEQLLENGRYYAHHPSLFFRLVHLVTSKVCFV